jgi:thioredoxin-like negative regulator of GroEL
MTKSDRQRFGYDVQDSYKDQSEKIAGQKTRKAVKQAQKAAKEAQKSAQEAKQAAGQAKTAVEYVKVNRYLQDIANAFSNEDYDGAVRRATEGLRIEPKNVVLPFVYSQALFARKQYSNAAGVLRKVLMKVDVEQQGVFYSLGFYRDKTVLDRQIEMLSEAVRADSDNAGFQLVLGYQLLGVGKYDQALEALKVARKDYVNKEAAEVLMQILKKTRQQSDQ